MLADAREDDCSRFAGEMALLAVIVVGAFVFRAAIDPFSGDGHQWLGSEEDQARSRAAGLDAHLTKPVDPAAIDQVLTLLGCAGEVIPSATRREQQPSAQHQGET